MWCTEEDLVTFRDHILRSRHFTIEIIDFIGKCPCDNPLDYLTPKFTTGSTVSIGTFVSELPQAVLTSTIRGGLRHNKTPRKIETKRSLFSLVRLVALVSNPRPELAQVLERKPKKRGLKPAPLARPRELTKLDVAQRHEIVRLYRDGWSVPQLAKRVGAHGQTIRELLIAAGEEVRTSRSRSLTDAQIEDACCRRVVGETIDAIANATGGSPSSVRRALKNRGL